MKLKFLSSMPRSGSTLLKCLLNQRPDTYASNTSNLCDMIYAFNLLFKSNSGAPLGETDGLSNKDCVEVLQHKRYANIDSPIIFDKGRGWANSEIIEIMSQFQDDIKIVATVRPMNECLASLVKIVNPDNVSEFLTEHNDTTKQFFDSYTDLKHSYEKYPDNILLIEYHDLVNQTQEQLNRISDFIGVEKFTHDLNNIPPSTEIDTIWGIKDLHKVRSQVSKQEYSAKEILGEILWEHYSGGEFWNDKPEPSIKENLIDLQLDAGVRGDFKEGWKNAQQLEKETPTCQRAAFNRGWYLLQQGKLLEGHKLLDCGRPQDVFGNKHIGTAQPIWSGEEGTVLLNLEGGLGDQIKSYRWAFDLKERGNRVVISCSPELAPMFAENFPVVEHDAACSVYHDYWLPSMSAVVPFGYEYEDLKGTPYIERTADAVPGRIGVRWSGNPKFEHEQHRFFPADLMFDAVKGYDCVSLQRDKDAELKPEWMEQADVSDWAETRKSISECEIVITSCTSVAHLAAAMGVETWIVVPVLSYYLWALPGDVTPYYDSVTLFRQQEYGSWKEPFAKIRGQLQCMHTLKMAA